ncbi:hypothetical protein [Flavobacterium sp. SM2513]|uniref:hypothetical protein n=1 Tax=Flavobacterium sp. SM2513 TaxID=3424766 RepID=UPI003D7F9DBA
MKPTLLFLLFIFTFGACSVDDENFVTINGRVERDLTGEGIANQRVSIYIYEFHGYGIYTYRVELGSTEVITDDNGNFSFQAKDGERVLFSTSKEQDENYGTSELRSFRLTDSVILKVDKLLKYKIYVNNTTPVDENDFVKVDLNCFFCNTLVTKIENYGVDNVYYPAENPGGSGTSAYEETAWYGTNVNSIIYFSVEEGEDQYTLFWHMTKNGISTSGFTENLPVDADQVNEYHFDY